MKFVSAFILLIALLLQVSSRFVVVLDYEANKDYIAKVLCENRSKPKLGCRGKCYLKKQLAKADKEQNVPGKTGKNKTEESFVTLLKKSEHFLTAENIKSNYPHPANDLITGGKIFSVFHPPRA